MARAHATGNHGWLRVITCVSLEATAWSALLFVCSTLATLDKLRAFCRIVTRRRSNRRTVIVVILLPILSVCVHHAPALVRCQVPTHVYDFDRAVLLARPWPCLRLLWEYQSQICRVWHKTMGIIINNNGIKALNKTTDLISCLYELAERLRIYCRS